jgi:hypothetical protein
MQPSDQPATPANDLRQMVSNIISGVRQASGTFLADGRLLRQRMIDDGLILPVTEHATKPDTMCAVDGGRITKQLYSGDLLVAYAVSAESETAHSAGNPVSQQWAAALAHSKDTDKVCGIAMMCLEQSVLQRVGHEVRILDGSFYSPVIEINKTLSIIAPDARRLAEEVIEENNLTENLTKLLSGTNFSQFVALPKSDSSRDYGDMLSTKYEVDIAVNDKVLAAHLLQPGEMLKPRTFNLWKNRALITEPADWRYGRILAHDINTAITSATQAAEEDRLVVTYIKGNSPLTVIKAEYFRPEATDTQADHQLASTLLREAQVTHAQEPAAQYKADVLAKGVAVLERQLREIVIAELQTSGDDTLAALFSTQYRT